MAPQGSTGATPAGGGKGKVDANAASEALFGQRSLSERFGDLKGRELQEKIFSMYQARLAMLFVLFARLCSP